MRGQVTAFAIISVLMLIAVLSLFWISRAPNTEPETQRPNLDLEVCIEEEAGRAVLEAGLTGGSFDGVQEIGEAGISGLLPTHRTYISLVAWIPDHRSVANRPSLQLVFDTSNPLEKTGTNRFPSFTDVSATTTTLIRDHIRYCEDPAEITLTSVTYSNENIRIETRVIEQGRSPRDVTVTLPIPLRRYHEVLAAAMREDNSDPEFVFSSLNPDGFSIRAIGDITTGDSVVELRSHRALVGSEPYRFLTIITDRPPVFLGTDFDNLDIGCDAGGIVERGAAINYIDPDDHHNPVILTCELDPVDSTNALYTFTSNGQSYTFEASS